MNFNREQAFINIYSMNNIIRSLNDEELMEDWLMNCVPDGCDTLEDVKNLYDIYDDEELGKEYENHSHLFARIVKSAVKDGYDMWTYVGQSPDTAAGERNACIDELRKRDAEIAQFKARLEAVVKECETEKSKWIPAMEYESVVKRSSMVDRYDRILRAARGEGSVQQRA